MESQCGSDDDLNWKTQEIRRPLYTIRQPPLIQPLRLSEFTQRACSQLSIFPDNIAHEWVTLFQAIAPGGISEGMQLQIPDTVLLSPSGHPSVWYTTSSTGKIKAKDLMRVSPQAILEAFQMPLSRRYPLFVAEDPIAVKRLGFNAETLSLRELKIFCNEMERPSVHSPLEKNSFALGGQISRPELTGRAFCLQRYIPCQQNARFLIVWRHLPTPLKDRAASLRGNSPRQQQIARNTEKASSTRAYSDAFVLYQSTVNHEHVAEEGSNESPESQKPTTVERFTHLDIDHPERTALKVLRLRGFDPDVMIPLLFYMKRVTSEMANCINREHNARQACGIACEFFVGAYDRKVFFSALQGIQWVGSPPSWESLSTVHPLSRSIHEFYEGIEGTSSLRKPTVSPRSQSTCVIDNASYYEQNPRFPSVYTPFASEKQWLYRSQLLAPDVSPRYLAASVPKIFRDGEFKPLLVACQTDSVIRLSLSPRAPSSLEEVRREQPHLSPRSASRRKISQRSSTAASVVGMNASASQPISNSG